VHLAWYAVGNGLPFLWMPAGPYTHTQYEWQVPETRALLERVAAATTLIRYDARGFSMSDRGPVDMSLDAQVMDIETVVAATKFDRFVMFVPGIMSVPALVYAARHPDRVTALLINGFARGADMALEPEWERSIKAARADWEIAKRLLGGFTNLWSMQATVAGLQEMLGRSTTQDAYLRWHEAVITWDATDDLPRITAPVLITYGVPTDRKQFELLRALATQLPDATLAVLPQDVEEVFRIQAEFIASVVARGDAQRLAESDLRTVIFTDVVGHSEMMNRLGDAEGRAVLREHESITRATLREYGGAEVKAMGDGFMASFGSVTRALECSVALQRAFAARNESSSEPLHVRIGLNAGEPIGEDGDLFGATVILASRIASMAGGGEILIPEPVRHLLSGKPFLFSARGEFVPKGFDEAVRLYEVVWRNAG
jgi:class 3 adenylate cyclase